MVNQTFDDFLHSIQSESASFVLWLWGMCMVLSAVAVFWYAIVNWPQPVAFWEHCCCWWAVISVQGLGTYYWLLYNGRKRVNVVDASSIPSPK